jgi:hypothetical protein
VVLVADRGVAGDENLRYLPRGWWPLHRNSLSRGPANFPREVHGHYSSQRERRLKRDRYQARPHGRGVGNSRGSAEEPQLAIRPAPQRLTSSLESKPPAEALESQDPPQPYTQSEHGENEQSDCFHTIEGRARPR